MTELPFRAFSHAFSEYPKTPDTKGVAELRDRFAMAALPCVWVRQLVLWDETGKQPPQQVTTANTDMDDVARRAYALADAMLKAREAREKRK